MGHKCGDDRERGLTGDLHLHTSKKACSLIGPLWLRLDTSGNDHKHMATDGLHSLMVNQQCLPTRMAATVIRNLSSFGLSRPVRTWCIPVEQEDAENEYGEEFREEPDDSFEEEDSPAAELQDEELWSENPSFGNTEMTDRLLRFAELISSDVQRYFGRSHDPDACDIYAERASPQVSGRQRYYADFMRVASSEKGEEPEKLGPLAELFKEVHRKRQGLPMSQRRLPSSFWAEPRTCHLGALGDTNKSDILSCSTETVLSSRNTPGSMLSTSNTPETTISSSSTPDFSDLLAQWATDRDNASEFSCDYQLP